MRVVDAFEGFEAGKAGHVLVEHYEREFLVVEGIEGIAAAADGHDIVALVFQEQYMGFQQIDFIVCPKDAVHSKKR